MKTLTGLKAVKNILDPIHGPIPITQLELDIISTPIFQRLRSITQLSLTSLVYPGATHNRFQHCLGTMYIMDKLLYTLKLEEKLPSDSDRSDRIIQLMRLGGLLHDCGHLPFSHTFENLYEGGNHEYFGKCIVERSVINEILKKNNVNPKSVGEFVNHNVYIKDPDQNEIRELLPLMDSNADADRMDYLLRDSYFTGVPYGRFDLDRICNFITKYENRICFYEKAQDALEDFLFSRYQMYKIVYIHKTVICYELILHKLYKYIKKYSKKLDLPFLLPQVEVYETSDVDWFNDTLSYLDENSFFKCIQIMLDSGKIESKDKDNLKNLYICITNRKAIKNCYRIDDLAAFVETEYCDRESEFFKKLQEHPKVINHWSFLRYDPSKPIQVASPIDKNFDDSQDHKQIRILLITPDGHQELCLLQERTNSVIGELARHHRVLICYYHDIESSQKFICDLAENYISPSSDKIS